MTITDTFNRADNASSLGTTSDGSATWTADDGTWGISSNQAYCSAIAGGASSGVATVSSVADGTVQLTVAANAGGLAGIAFRVVDSANLWFFGRGSASFLNGLWKRQSGSLTQIGAVGTINVGDVVSVDLSGSSITCKVNGTTVASATDSFNSTAARNGLYSENIGNLFDDFTAPSIAAPAPAPWRPMIRPQAVARASVI